MQESLQSWRFVFPSVFFVLCTISLSPEASRLCLLPLGDSITQGLGDSNNVGLNYDVCHPGQNSWRYFLVQRLLDYFSSSRVDLDTLGSLTNHYRDPLNSTPFDFAYGRRCLGLDQWANISYPYFQHEGHFSWLLSDAVNGTKSRGYHATTGSGGVRDWARTSYRPDILKKNCSSVCVVVHLGTNDVWSGSGSGSDVERVAQDLLRLRQALREELLSTKPPGGVDPDLAFVIAEPIPIAWLPERFGLFGEAIRRVFNFSDSVTVDLYSEFTSANLTHDGVHPNGPGADLMAQRLFPAVVNHCVPRLPVVTAGTGTTTVSSSGHVPRGSPSSTTFRSSWPPTSLAGSSSSRTTTPRTSAAMRMHDASLGRRLVGLVYCVTLCVTLL